MTPKHTPLPWRILDNHPKHVCLHIQSTQSDEIADEVATLYVLDMFPAMAAANAELIIRAVNAHDDLVAALENLLEFAPTDDLEKQASAALAKAQGETK